MRGERDATNMALVVICRSINKQIKQTMRQSMAVFVFVQEIQKLEQLQHELGQDVGHVFEAFQKEVPTIPDISRMIP